MLTELMNVSKSSHKLSTVWVEVKLLLASVIQQAGVINVATIAPGPVNWSFSASETANSLSGQHHRLLLTFLKLQVVVYTEAHIQLEVIMNLYKYISEVYVACYGLYTVLH